MLVDLRLLSHQKNPVVLRNLDSRAIELRASDDGEMPHRMNPTSNKSISVNVIPMDSSRY